MFLDTSAVIEILRHARSSAQYKRIKEHMGSEELYILVVQLAELSDWCIENNAPVRDRVEAVKKFANILSLEEETCLEGSSIKAERRRKGYKDFSLLDGLVLAAARSMGERLLTFDNDFERETDCILLT